MKEFACTVLQSQIHLAFTVMHPAWGRMMDIADSGCCENYHVAGGTCAFKPSFSSNFIRMVRFL
jgi:hypothetical protein